MAAYFWEYMDDALEWSSFDDVTATTVENAFNVRQSATVTYALPSSGLQFLLHFSQHDGWQVNTLTKKTRPLRRVPSPAGGQASWEWYMQERGSWHPYPDHLFLLMESTWELSEGSKILNTPHGAAGLWATINSNQYLICFGTHGYQVPVGRDGIARGVRRRVPSHLLQDVDSAVFDAGVAVALRGNLGYDPACLVDAPSPPSLPKKEDEEEEDCPVCAEALFAKEAPPPPEVEEGEEEGEQEAGLEQGGASLVVKLSECNHMYHRSCIVQWLQTRPSCPMCLHHYGVVTGTQPKEGAHMWVSFHTYQEGSYALDGFPGTDVILVRYYFDDGIQGPEHPNPGQPYSGTRRTAYLPNNAMGQDILRLLRLAWDRRLLFRVGRSLTTGLENTVVWATIHHKTKTHGGAANFGYPDETYFARVRGELADQGVI
eukprot:jgi/Mesen1/9153/ME000587S08649